VISHACSPRTRFRHFSRIRLIRLELVSSQVCLSMLWTLVTDVASRRKCGKSMLLLAFLRESDWSIAQNRRTVSDDSKTFLLHSNIESSQVLAPFTSFTLLAHRKRLHHSCLVSIFVLYIVVSVEILCFFLRTWLAQEMNSNERNAIPYSSSCVASLSGQWPLHRMHRLTWSAYRKRG
jgi:hypothetical protein